MRLKPLLALCLAFAHALAGAHSARAGPTQLSPLHQCRANLLILEQALAGGVPITVQPDLRSCRLDQALLVSLGRLAQPLVGPRTGCDYRLGPEPLSAGGRPFCLLHGYWDQPADQSLAEVFARRARQAGLGAIEFDLDLSRYDPHGYGRHHDTLSWLLHIEPDLAMFAVGAVALIGALLQVLHGFRRWGHVHALLALGAITTGLVLTGDLLSVLVSGESLPTWPAEPEGAVRITRLVLHLGILWWGLSVVHLGVNLYSGISTVVPVFFLVGAPIAATLAGSLTLRQFAPPLAVAVFGLVYALLARAEITETQAMLDAAERVEGGAAIRLDR